MAGAAVAHHPIQAALDDAFADPRGEVAGIEADRATFRSKAGARPVQALKVRRGVIDVAGVTWVSTIRAYAIDGAVIQIEEADGFLVAHHEARVGVDRAALYPRVSAAGASGVGSGRSVGSPPSPPGPARKGSAARPAPGAAALARGGPLGIHRGVQFGQVGRRRLLDLHKS